MCTACGEALSYLRICPRHEESKRVETNRRESDAADAKRSCRDGICLVATCQCVCVSVC
jgi:hypothetical protein